MVEFALVSVLLMFFIYAIAAFGVMLSTKNSLTHAASEGARSALSVSDLPASSANTALSATPPGRRVTQAVTTVTKYLGFLGSNASNAVVNATIANCSTAVPLVDTTQCITVTVTYPWSAHPLIPAAPGLGLVTPNNMTATAVVRLT